MDYFEGDIKLTQQLRDYIKSSRQGGDLHTRALIKDARRLWTNGVVPYSVAEDLSKYSNKYNYFMWKGIEKLLSQNKEEVTSRDWDQYDHRLPRFKLIRPTGATQPTLGNAQKSYIMISAKSKFDTRKTIPNKDVAFLLLVRFFGYLLSTLLILKHSLHSFVWRKSSFTAKRHATYPPKYVFCFFAATSIPRFLTGNTLFFLVEPCKPI